MSVHKTDAFVADVERQFEWYKIHAGREVAERYLATVEATCQLLSQHPQLGPRGGFVHPRLREWRSVVVSRPFKMHIIFYDIAGDNVVMRRAMHGHRDLPRRLLEPPGAG